MNYTVLVCMCIILPWNATSFDIIRDVVFPRNPTINRVRNLKDAGGDEFAVLDTVGIVQQFGYSVEEHNVTTMDDYNVMIFRIYETPTSPKKQGKPVVYLQHGLFASSDSWVVYGPERDLAYLLADRGYDIWIGNLRGNSYGRSHNHFSTQQREFWNFSYQEHGVGDLASMIDYVLKYTDKETLSYIGHSMGTTLAYILLSEKPEYNKKIDIFVSLAPTAMWKEPPKTLISLSVLPVKRIMKILDENKIWEVGPQTAYNGMLGKAFCSDGSPFQPYCIVMFSFMAGPDPKQMNATLLPLFFAYYPAGASAMTVAHYQQNVKAGIFQKFDFGRAENLRRYGQETPPPYDLKKISAPVALIYGKNDILALESNTAELAKVLPNVVTFEAVPYDKFNHLDFIIANDVKKLLYDRVIELIEKYSK